MKYSRMETLTLSPLERRGKELGGAGKRGEVKRGEEVHRRRISRCKNKFLQNIYFFLYTDYYSPCMKIDI